MGEPGHALQALSPRLPGCENYLIVLVTVAIKELVKKKNTVLLNKLMLTKPVCYHLTKKWLLAAKLLVCIRWVPNSPNKIWLYRY